VSAATPANPAKTLPASANSSSANDLLDPDILFSSKKPAAKSRLLPHETLTAKSTALASPRSGLCAVRRAAASLYADGVDLKIIVAPRHHRSRSCI
jgi:hypothetical protein